MPAPTQSDEFTEGDLKRWELQYTLVVQQGRALCTSDSDLGSNKVACAQCHRNAANAHPETYPKFQKHFGGLVAFWEMINSCIRNPLKSKSLAADDPEMIGLRDHAAYERRGVKLEPGKH